MILREYMNSLVFFFGKILCDQIQNCVTKL